MSTGRPTLGDLIIKTSLAYQTIRDIRITSEEGKHGCLKAILEIEEPANAAQAAKLTGQAVEVSLRDGTRLFTGECTGAGLTSQGGYQCICLTAATRSVRMDRKKQKRTFQDPGKTLASVCSEIGGTYGAFITIGQDLPLSHVLSQQDETDWEFLLRIAAASGKVIYTDPLAEGIRIFVGETGFRRHGEDILEAECGITRNLAEMASIEANQGEAAEGYMVDRMEAACSTLTATAGDTAGISVIRKGEISQKGGLLQNHVSYGYPESVRPSAENALQPGFASGVLQGSVLAVSQNQIQVKFTSDKGAGETTWIPYESFFSNSFYCMPDEGDQVYVYYENNGKIACLGSRHTQTSHPDFARPEEKTLTSQDKMIKLTESGIKLTATREQTDQESDQAVAIYMDEKDGITIQSGRQITWEAKKSIRLGVDVPKDADASREAGAEKLKERVKTGKKQFETEGGYVALAASQFAKQQGKQLLEFGKSMIFYDLWHKEGEEQAGEALDAEQFESGVLTLYGQSSVTLIVGDKSSIKLGEDIQIQTGEFRWLGYEQGEHAKEEKPLQDWWETALDGLQLALDIAGCIPVLGAIPDLINAGISLCRGDFMGAAMSAVAAIPIVGEAATAVKLGAKAVKTVTKLTKAQRMLSIAKGVFLLSQSAYIIYQSRDGLAEIWKKLENGENPFTDPACVSTMLNTLNAGVMGARGAKSIGDGVIGKKTITKYEGDPEKQHNTEGKGSKGAKEKAKNETDCGDPINVVTGSLTMCYTDLVLKDTGEDFVLKRMHESVHTNEGMMLGNRWFLNIETRLQRNGEEITLQKPDMHLETFRLREQTWENERNKDASFTLTETEEGYLVRDNAGQKTYAYNEKGQLTGIIDACGNQTKLVYEGGVLEKLILASGQSLEFTFTSDKLTCIRDTLGRQITYAYEGDWLTAVTLPNEGTIRYRYTNQGFLHQVQDQNGHTYVTTEYDRRGRATRQTLATGEEYLLFYDEKNHRNTFTNTKSGEKIIYEYGRQRVPLAAYYEDGTHWEKRYDDWENCIYERDCNGNETFREYDCQGNLLKETQADGTVTAFEYDSAGRKTRKTDSMGGEERFAYDSRGCLVRHALRLEGETYAVTTFTRDSRGRILTETNANGNEIHYAYETAFAEPSMKEFPEGETTWYTYDAAGRCMETRDASGTTSYTYNRADDITAVTDPLGNTTHYSYDLLGNLTELCPPEQHATGRSGIRSRYDALDRKIEEVTPEGNRYLYRYGSEDQLIQSIHPAAEAKGREDGITYEYDSRSRRIRAHYPDGGVERYFYDGNGNVIRRIPPETYDPLTDDGNGYRYTYDAGNRLTSIVNPEGNLEAAYTYDGAGRILSYTVPGPEGTRAATYYTYNHAGFMTSCRKAVEEGENKTTRYRLTVYRYDAMGNRLEEKRYLEPQGAGGASGKTHSIRYQYDRSNRLKTVEDDTGAVLEYGYDDMGRRDMERMKIKEGTFREICYRYDGAGRVTGRYERLEEGVPGTEGIPYAVTEYRYDRNGNPTRVRLPGGGRIHYAYDADNRLTGERHEEPHGEIKNETTYAYDPAGNLIRETDASGNTREYTYDLMDRRTSEKGPEGGIKRMDYDRGGRLVREVLPQEEAQKGILANGYTYQYDSAGRRTAAVGPDGTLLERRVYDSAGNLAELYDGVELGGEPQTDNNAVHPTDKGIQTACTRYAYDLAGRRTLVETPGGSRQEFWYDAFGNLTATRDGMGNLTRFQPDAWGRITRITRADGSVEQYVYDHAGNLTEAVDGEGHRVTYAYNCRNLQERRTDAAGCADIFRYDLEGNLTECIDRNGRKLRLTYNMYHSLTGRRSADGDVDEAYGYYPDGKLRYAIGGGMRYDYVYDAAGRLTEKRAGGRTLLSYTYDRNGNRTSLTDLTGKRTEYRYDQLDRLAEVHDNGVRQALYRYHADGTVRTLETGTGLHTEYRYDRDKNLIRLQTSVSAGAGEKEEKKKELLLDNRYAYDAAGNCIKKQCIEGETSFRYDSLQQLTEAVYPWGSERYTYDHAGNRLGVTAAERREEYRYDAAGRLAERLVFGRQEGPGKGKEKEENRTGDARRTDAGRTDVTKTDAGYAGSGSTGNESYFIHTDTQRCEGPIEKSLAGSLGHAEIGNTRMQGAVCPTELVLSASYQYSYDRQGNTLSDGEHQYRYDSLNRLTEVKTQNGDLQRNRYDGEGLRAELEENGELTRFLYSGRDVVAEQDGKSNTIRYIRGLELLASDCECARTYYHYASDELGSITHVTDENGTVLNRYVYDAFGNHTVRAETVQNRFGFTGEICDGLTGQYYLRARFYNPVIGRFLNEDTYYGDGLNLYSYCRNNPVRYVDPSGHSCEGKEGRNTSNNSNKGIKPSFTDEEIAKLKKTVIDEGQALKDMGITNNQLGPAIAGAYDKTTGKIYTAINDCDGKIPSELHPIIKERIESMPQEIYDSYIEHTKGAGSHAEVYAVNKALLANPEVDINNIVVYVNRTLGTSKPVIELPFKTCPHCRYILDGFNIISNNN